MPDMIRPVATTVRQRQYSPNAGRGRGTRFDPFGLAIDARRKSGLKSQLRIGAQHQRRRERTIPGRRRQTEGNSQTLRNSRMNTELETGFGAVPDSCRHLIVGYRAREESVHVLFVNPADALPGVAHFPPSPTGPAS